MEDRKLHKPTPADYEKRAGFNRLFNEGKRTNELTSKYLDFMSSIDWDIEVFNEGDKYGIRSPLGEILLPPEFENFRMMTMQELKNGDRVVTQLGGNGGLFWQTALVHG